MSIALAIQHLFLYFHQFRVFLKLSLLHIKIFIFIYLFRGGEITSFIWAKLLIYVIFYVVARIYFLTNKIWIKTGSEKLKLLQNQMSWNGTGVIQNNDFRAAAASSQRIFRIIPFPPHLIYDLLFYLCFMDRLYLLHKEDVIWKPMIHSLRAQRI